MTPDSRAALTQALIVQTNNSTLTAQTGRNLSTCRMTYETIQAFSAVIGTLFVTACATDPVPLDQSRPSALPQQAAVSAADCASPQALPQINCSDTVTASFDHNGKLWIVWVQQQHIYLQASDDAGRHFSTPVMVNAEAEAVAAHGEYRPKIKIGPEGNIYLTWTQSLEKRHTGHIRFSRSTDGGKSFSRPVTVNDNLDVISHRFDALAVGKTAKYLSPGWTHAIRKRPKSPSRSLTVLQCITLGPATEARASTPTESSPRTVANVAAWASK